MGLGTRELLLIIRGQDELSKVLRGVGMNFTGLSAAAQQAAQKQIALGSAVSTVGLGMAAVGGVALKWMGDSVAASKDFANQVALVKTQVDDVNVSQQQLADVSKGVAKNIAVPLDNLNASLYDIFSSMDVNVTQSQQLLTGFSKAAVAGQVDVQTAGRATIAIMNAWHLPISDVNQILDVQFELVKKGVGTYQEFASTIGQAIPSAQRAGQSIFTLSGMLAYLTRNGLSASMASASAQRALDAFANPTTQTRLQQMGIAVTDSSGNFRDFSDVIVDLQKKLANLTQPERAAALQKLFAGSGGTIQARRFYDTVLESSSAVQQYTGLVNDMKNSSGALAQAYGTMSNTVASRTQVLKNQYDLLKISVGDALIPIFSALIPILQKIVEWWNNLGSSTQKIIVYIVAGTAALFVVGGAILFVVGTFIMMAGAAALLDVALAPIILIILAIVVAIGALVAGAILTITHWTQISNAIKSVWVPVVHALGDAWNWFWNNILKPIVTWIWSEIGTKLVALWKQISTDVGNVWHDIAGNVETGLHAVSAFISSTLKSIETWWHGAWSGISATLHVFEQYWMAIWPNIKNIFAAALQFIVAIWQAVWGTIVGVFKAVWRTIVDVLTGVWDIIKGLVTGLIHIFEGIIDFIVGVFTGNWHKAWQGLKEIFQGFCDIIVGIWDGFWHIIGGILTGAWHIIAAVVTGAWDILVGAFKYGISVVRNIWDIFINGLVQVWKTIWRAVSSFWSQEIWPAFTSAFQRGIDAISAIWNGIKKIAAVPVNFVIDYVYNKGIRWLWNKIADFVGLGELPLAQDVSFARGGYTGNGIFGTGGKYDPAGIVHAGEYVIRQEQVRKWLPLLEAINNGYATGGPVRAIGPALPVTGTSADPGNGSGGILSQLISMAGGAASDVVNWLTSPFQAVIHAIGNSAEFVQTIAKIPEKAMTGIINTLWQKVQAGVKTAIQGTDTARVVTTYPNEVGYAMSLFPKYGWGQDQVNDLIQLWNRESGWNPNAVNPTSGAYGIPQALGHGHPYNLGDWMAQINWGENYIVQRYLTPAAAWAHEMAVGWYDTGGRVPRGFSGIFNGTSGDEHLSILTTNQWAVLHQLANKPSSPNGGGNTYNITVQGINIYTNEIDPAQHARELGFYLGSMGGSV